MNTMKHLSCVLEGAHKLQQLQCWELRCDTVQRDGLIWVKTKAKEYEYEEEK